MSRRRARFSAVSSGAGQLRHQDARALVFTSAHRSGFGEARIHQLPKHAAAAVVTQHGGQQPARVAVFVLQRRAVDDLDDVLLDRRRFVKDLQAAVRRRPRGFPQRVERLPVAAGPLGPRHQAAEVDVPGGHQHDVPRAVPLAEVIHHLVARQPADALRPSPGRCGPAGACRNARPCTSRVRRTAAGLRTWRSPPGSPFFPCRNPPAAAPAAGCRSAVRPPDRDTPAETPRNTRSALRWCRHWSASRSRPTRGSHPPRCAWPCP